MDPRTRPPYKIIGLLGLMVLALVGTGLYAQFRGAFIPKTKLTMLAPRAGLVTDPGAKVTYNGVQIGRVASISEVTRDGVPAAKLVLDVDPKYIDSIPANVGGEIKATTVFGNKYVSLTSPKIADPQHINPSMVIDATAVTTEFNTLFQTLTAIAEKVDPVKLNLTLGAAAQALSGLGDKFGAALVNGSAILDDVNPRLPMVRADIQGLAALGDVYADAAPDLWTALDQAVTTARTTNHGQAGLDAALLAAVGLGNNGSDVFGRGGPYLARGPPIWLSPASCSTSTAPKSSVPSATTTKSGPKSALHSASPATRWGRFRQHYRRTQPLHLSGEPAAGQRPGRTGRETGVLATDHSRLVARPVSGDGCRRQRGALQPCRTRPADVHRICLGTSVRRVHDQSLTEARDGKNR
ncbi:mce related family protein [Mycobacterium kansasii]|uniref:Mce related family protein n=1 Tax=Mycobacterium kansasii TaxID=1768 RepID=A0A1V3X8T3_MYCKA|nr:mce related family protein [Mycobacterium kansasii]